MRFSSYQVKIHQSPHVNSSFNFASFFTVIANNNPGNFKLINFQLWTKESYQSPNFETFNCSGENFPNFSCYFPNHKLVFLQILHHSLVSWKITSLGQRLPERTFWDFWVLGSKFTKFLSFLKQQISFASSYFNQSWVPSNITSLYFLSWSIIYFGQKQPIKVNSFSNFASFFFVITHNSPVNFKLIHLLLGIKVPHKSPNFESQLSSALVKICQIPHVIFQTTSQFFFKFCITL